MTVSNQFVSSFSAWASETGYPVRVRRRLPRLLRQLPDLLRDSDCRQELFARTLDNDHDLRIRVESPTHGVYTSGKKIVFYAIGPSWNLRHLSKDEETSEMVWSFLFFAGQYALRSRILRATSAVALTYGVLCDFRDASVYRVTFGPESLVASLSEARKELETSVPAESASGRARKARTLKAWMARLNMMDPFVHRAVFQYWRALSLWNSAFGEDAITALDNISAVAGDAAMDWTRSGNLSRRQVASTLGLGVNDADALDRLHDLRCSFGAHPAASNWWDFAEIYGDAVDLLFDSAQRVIGSISDLERLHRSVDPDPTSWSCWFEENSEMLLEAVWFTRVP